MRSQIFLFCFDFMQAGPELKVHQDDQCGCHTIPFLFVAQGFIPRGSVTDSASLNTSGLNIAALCV